MKAKEQPVDDKGTGQSGAQRELNQLLSEGFDGSVDKLAIALGRDETYVRELLNEGRTIDDDLMMKIRGIANQRNVNPDQAPTK